MQRHLTTSTVGFGKRSNGGSARASAARVGAALDTGLQRLPDAVEQGAPPTATPVRTHTVILTGELTHRSAHALEVEIERLCDEGVNTITLDLRQLEQIDSIGVAVIAFRSGLCQRQGFGFTLISGPRQIQRAFEQAGVSELLSFQLDEVAARRLRTPKPRQPFLRRV
jgi:anti-anti-sigma factor